MLSARALTIVGDPLAKLDHARRHLDLLAETVGTFLATGPYRVTNVEVAGERIYRVEVLADPPGVIGLIVADCVHNLRSALDQLVSAIARDHGVSDARTQFPIVATAAAWTKAKRDISGLPPAAQQTLDSLQPFHHADPSHSLLHVVNALWNQDKHRSVVVAGTCVAAAQWPSLVPGTIPNLTLGLIADGTVVARAVVTDETDPTFTFAIAFGTGSPTAIIGASVVTILELVHHYVTNEVIPTFVTAMGL